MKGSCFLVRGGREAVLCMGGEFGVCDGRDVAGFVYVRICEGRGEVCSMR